MKLLSTTHHKLKDDFIRYTRQVWQPRLGRDLNCEDLRQITENLTGFFTVLARWSRPERATQADENDVGLSTNLIVNEGDQSGADPLIAEWPPHFETNGKKANTPLHQHKTSDTPKHQNLRSESHGTGNGPRCRRVRG